MPQPLPTALPESSSTSNIHFKLAYSKILKLEQDALSDTDPKIGEQKLVCARLLGYLIWEGLSMDDSASEHITKEVNSCQNYEQSYRLGGMYLDHYICIINKYKDPTSSSSSPFLSYLPFKTKEELVKDMLYRSEPSQHSRQALIRDGFQCIVTGKYDYQSTYQCPELEQKVNDSSAPQICISECTHIFPHIDSNDKTKHEYASATSAWTIMKNFAHEGLLEKLIGDGIHALDNVMTFSHDIHIWFDTLNLWFEAMDNQENTYAIHATKSYFLYGCKPNPITLISQHPDFPLPNPTYLKIHAACCRVAHLSGATKYIKKILDDQDLDQDDGDGSPNVSPNELQN